MAYTFLQFQQFVARRTKTQIGSADVLLLLKDAINIAYYELCREMPQFRLLIGPTTISLTGADSGTPIALPTDFLAIERLRFTATAMPSRPYKLFPREGLVPPASVAGSPRAYALQSKTPFAISYIYLEPFSGIAPTTDTLSLWYYRFPALLVNDADLPVLTQNDAEIIRRSCDWMYATDNRLDQAKEVLMGIRQMQQQPQPSAQ